MVSQIMCEKNEEQQKKWFLLKKKMLKCHLNLFKKNYIWHLTIKDHQWRWCVHVKCGYIST